MNNDRTAPNVSSGANKQELIAFLDKEIENIQAEITRPGWTNWAIIAGVATVIWLMYSEIEGGKFDIKNVLVLILGFSLSYPFISSALRLISHSPLTPYLADNRYYYYKKERSSLSNFLSLVFFISGWVITKYLDNGSTQIHELFSYIFHGAWIFIFSVAFIASLTNFLASSDSGLSPSSGQKVLLAGVTIFNLFGIGATIRYLQPLVIVQKSISIYDIRVSSLVVAMYILIRLLARTPEKTPILEQLIRINRDISLDRIEPETAKKQIDLAMNGLQSADILQKHIDGYLSIMQQFEKEALQVRQKIDVRRNLHNAEKELSEENKIISESLEKDISTHMIRLEKLLNEDLYKSLVSLGFQSAFLLNSARISSSYSKNRLDLISMITDIQKGVESRYIEIEKLRELDGTAIVKKDSRTLRFIDQLLKKVI